MPRLSLVSLLLLALAGCEAGDPAVQTTDGGSWVVTLQLAEAPIGWAELPLSVVDADGEPAPALILSADVTMPSMGHGSTEPVTGEELGEGEYLVHAFVQMAGEWALQGSLDAGDGPEDFSHTFDVVAE